MLIETFLVVVWGLAVAWAGYAYGLAKSTEARAELNRIRGRLQEVRAALGDG